MLHLVIDIQVAGAFSSIFLSQKLTKLQDTQIGRMKIENNACKQTKNPIIKKDEYTTMKQPANQQHRKRLKEPQISKEL